MNIPGLSHIPIQDPSTDTDAIKLTSFNMKTFTVPGAHRYGNCRQVHDYERICTIGEGNFGTVYKVRDKASNEIFALKRLKTGKEMELMPQQNLREITNLKLLNHVNIVNLICIAVGKNVDSTYLILDFCSYVLSRVIDQVPLVFLQHPQIKCIMMQLLTGLDYIHKNYIVHRDLGPNNILFTSDGILKITDFGLSRKVSSGDMTPNQGLRWYKAPEILFGAEQYGLAVDMWAVGCVFAEMLRQKVLFRADNEADVIKLMIGFLGTPKEATWPGHSELPVPKHYILEYQPYNRIRSTFQNQTLTTCTMMQKLLTYNPERRPTAEECLLDPYFLEYPRACPVTDLPRTLQQSRRL